MEPTEFQGKVVLITGASGSIGSAVAVQFARLGANVTLAGRDVNKLKSTADKCYDAGATHQQILTVTGDIREEEDVTFIVETTVTTFGGLDILVNCAGVIRSGDFLTTKLSDYDLVYKTNVKGTFTVCQHAIPYIINRKGSIVNVSSFTGIRPAFNYFAYTASQAALDHMTRCLALDLGPKGVRVNSVNPGVIRSKTFWTREGAPFASDPDVVEKLQDDLTKFYPLRRLAEVSDVVKVIVFLTSNLAAFVDGVVLPLDGGKVLTAQPALIAS